MKGNQVVPVVFRSLGEGAVTMEAAVGMPPGWNERLRAFARFVAETGFPGFVEAAAGIHTVTIFYDVYLLYNGLDKLERDYPCLREEQPQCLQEVVSRLLRLLWDRLEHAANEPGRLVDIPVAYGGEWGPDLEETARLCGMTAAELVELHSGCEYRVLMLGFMPGFPYLDGLSPRLRVDRLALPRLRVPAGSVALGGGQTGIYPQEAPGGWRLIGRTSSALFRPDAGEPFLLRAGDRVRFVPSAAGGKRAVNPGG